MIRQIKVVLMRALLAHGSLYMGLDMGLDMGHEMGHYIWA